MKIDVIIPVYRPGEELPVLLERLKRQTMPIHKIILMNTEEKYFADWMSRTRTNPVRDHGNVEVHHLAREEFDHGGTRRRAVQYSEADIFVMMTQDAVPADERLIEKLTRCLREGLEPESAGWENGARDRGSDGRESGVRGRGSAGGESGARIRVPIAVSYGRQIPARGCGEAERAARHFNYPPESAIRTAADLKTMGIRTYFCSNVCAAYRRDIYEESDGFAVHTIFNEDMIYAAWAVRAGYGIAYEAEAKVIHSHQYTNMQQLRRNFDLGVSQAEHPEVFAGVASEAEGKRLVRETFLYMKKRRRLYRFPAFCVQCAFKYAGYRLGRNYRRLPGKWVTALTANRAYWRQEEEICAEL